MKEKQKPDTNRNKRPKRSSQEQQIAPGIWSNCGEVVGEIRYSVIVHKLLIKCFRVAAV